MSERFAALEEVITLLQSGDWELGYSDGIRSDGRYWLQQGGLCAGGQTLKVRAGTVRALERRNLIAIVPQQPKQPFWLRRYRLATEQESK